MSIELFTGKPGSGKSMDACRVVRRFLKSGRDVIANFPIAVADGWSGNYYYVPNRQLDPDVIVQIACRYWQNRKFKEEGLLLVVDEAQLLWNSRLWSQDKNRMKWLELMSQNRKYGLKVILVCQSDIMIDKQFRTLVEYEVKHRKLSNLGTVGLLSRYLFFGEIFYAVKKYYGIKDLKIDGYFYRASKKICNMYNSYTTFQQLEKAI